MSQCITSCPQGYLRVNDSCEECIRDCVEGMIIIMYSFNVFQFYFLLLSTPVTQSSDTFTAIVASVSVAVILTFLMIVVTVILVCINRKQKKL